MACGGAWARRVGSQGISPRSLTKKSTRSAVAGCFPTQSGVPVMCAGDDHNCPQFEQHRQKLLDDFDNERRSFLKSAFVASGGAAAAWAASGTLATPASAQSRPGRPTYHYLPATADT